MLLNRRHAIAWFFAAFLFCALLSCAGSASAATQQFLAVTASTQGKLKGDAVPASFKDQITLQGLSVSPATPGATPSTVSVTMSTCILPQLVSALISGEVMTKGLITVQNAGEDGKMVTQYQVQFRNARVTSLTLRSAAGDPSVQVDFTTSAAVSYLDGKGNALTTDIPSIAAPSPTSGRGSMTAADKLTCSGGFSATIPLTGVAWHLSAPAGGGGPVTVDALTFTKASDGNSDALKAAAGHGEGLAGTKLVWSAVSSDGTTKPILRLDIGSAKLSISTRGAKIAKASGTETYSVSFTTAPAGSNQFALTRGTMVATY
jgi:type VI protein secretion system component Hcp